MVRLRLLGFSALGVALIAAACATGTIVSNNDGGPPPSDASVDAGSCPQYDLQTDPKHCGSCTNACASNQVCSQGACKAQCDPPTIKCSGGNVCVDVTKDPQNCGTCGTSCNGPDAGPDTGTGNPDAGVPIPDGGFDSGMGWSFGTPGCTNSQCNLTCASGTSLCTDNLCWDTNNAHDHCGSCGTACQSTEWCGQGHCCATGTEWCGSACVNVLTDKNNCGVCGNVCPTNQPTCVSGKCSVQVAVTTVCGLNNPSGILCSGNCSTNHAQYADAYCKLAGYTSAVSYTVLTSGSVTCLYYNTQNTVPTQCSQILGPTTYGLASSCDAIQNLMCQ